jgi:hypothetical protein
VKQSGATSCSRVAGFDRIKPETGGVADGPTRFGRNLSAHGSGHHGSPPASASVEGPKEEPPWNRLDSIQAHADRLHTASRSTKIVAAAERLSGKAR